MSDRHAFVGVGFCSNSAGLPAAISKRPSCGLAWYSPGLVGTAGIGFSATFGHAPGSLGCSFGFGFSGCTALFCQLDSPNPARFRFGRATTRAPGRTRASPVRQ